MSCGGDYEGGIDYDNMDGFGFSRGEGDFLEFSSFANRDSSRLFVDQSDFEKQLDLSRAFPESPFFDKGGGDEREEPPDFLTPYNIFSPLSSQAFDPSDFLGSELLSYPETTTQSFELPPFFPRVNEKLGQSAFVSAQSSSTFKPKTSIFPFGPLSQPLGSFPSTTNAKSSMSTDNFRAPSSAPAPVEPFDHTSAPNLSAGFSIAPSSADMSLTWPSPSSPASTESRLYLSGDPVPAVASWNPSADPLIPRTHFDLCESISPSSLSPSSASVSPLSFNSFIKDQVCQAPPALSFGSMVSSSTPVQNASNQLAWDFSRAAALIPGNPLNSSGGCSAPSINESGRINVNSQQPVEPFSTLDSQGVTSRNWLVGLPDPASLASQKLPMTSPLGVNLGATSLAPPVASSFFRSGSQDKQSRPSRTTSESDDDVQMLEVRETKVVMHAEHKRMHRKRRGENSEKSKKRSKRELLGSFLRVQQFFEQAATLILKQQKINDDSESPNVDQPLNNSTEVDDSLKAAETKTSIPNGKEDLLNLMREKFMAIVLQESPSSPDSGSKRPRSGSANAPAPKVATPPKANIPSGLESPTIAAAVETPETAKPSLEGIPSTASIAQWLGTEGSTPAGEESAEVTNETETRSRSESMSSPSDPSKSINALSDEAVKAAISILRSEASSPKRKKSKVLHKTSMDGSPERRDASQGDGGEPHSQGITTIESDNDDKRLSQDLVSLELELKMCPKEEEGPFDGTSPTCKTTAAPSPDLAPFPSPDLTPSPSPSRDAGYGFTADDCFASFSDDRAPPIPSCRSPADVVPV